MSSPARSWSATTIACASVNCSRDQGSIIAVSSGRPHMFIVYQRGRGHEPVTVAGSIRSFVAVKAIPTLSFRSGRAILRERRPRARELEDLDAVAVWIVEVDALAAVVRPADHGDRPGRPERDPPLAPLLVERVEAVGHEADVRAA